MYHGTVGIFCCRPTGALKWLCNTQQRAARGVAAATRLLPEIGRQAGRHSSANWFEARRPGAVRRADRLSLWMEQCPRGAKGPHVSFHWRAVVIFLGGMHRGSGSRATSDSSTVLS